MSTMNLTDRIKKLSSPQRAALLERLPGDPLAGAGDNASKQLTAYLVCRPGRSLSPADLRNFLQPRLPEFMVPAQFVFLDALPLNANGKVDRRALPQLPAEPVEPEPGFAGPRNDTEKKLARIWMELLRLEQAGVHDNFFQRGGHSLLALQVMARVRDTFRVDLPLKTLFERPTIAGLAEAIAKSPQSTGPIKRVVRQSAGDRQLDPSREASAAEFNPSRNTL